MHATDGSSSWVPLVTARGRGGRWYGTVLSGGCEKTLSVILCGPGSYTVCLLSTTSYQRAELLPYEKMPCDFDTCQNDVRVFSVVHLGPAAECERALAQLGSGADHCLTVSSYTSASARWLHGQDASIQTSRGMPRASTRMMTCTAYARDARPGKMARSPRT